ncbi:hypothetical protein ACFVUS_28500 [Nocardia sp. NPDC058058]|uniref:hypothetical protein n=1 Tax=Nocardia sp. NPDC058058 TaxID=3346317 RepID=UPI0036DEB7B4
MTDPPRITPARGHRHVDDVISAAETRPTAWPAAGCARIAKSAALTAKDGIARCGRYWKRIVIQS